MEEVLVKDSRLWTFTIVDNKVLDDSDLDTYDKLTYIALCKFANIQNSSCYPSIATLCKVVGCGNKRLIKSIDNLIAKGYITKYKRKKENSNDTNIYIINKVVSEEHKGSVCRTQGVVSVEHKGSVPGTQELEPINKNQLNYNISSQKEIKTPYKEIVKAYNSICTTMSKVQSVTKKRKDLMRVRYKDNPDFNTFRELFTKANESDFLSGRNGKWSNCNFDWLLNENNMVSVLEGKYKNASSKPVAQTESYQHKKTAFHLAKSRGDKYTADELEAKILANSRKKIEEQKGEK